jgi:hypothetical protein
VKLPTTYASRQFYRRITDDEFSLADPRTGQIVFSFPLPMLALNVNGKYVASYAIRGVQMSHPTKNWERKQAESRVQFDRRQHDYPEVFSS